MHTISGHDPGVSASHDCVHTHAYLPIKQPHNWFYTKTTLIQSCTDTVHKISCCISQISTSLKGILIRFLSDIPKQIFCQLYYASNFSFLHKQSQNVFIWSRSLLEIHWLVPTWRSIHRHKSDAHPNAHSNKHQLFSVTCPHCLVFNWVFIQVHIPV